MLYKTKLEACRAWVETFNAIPANVIEKLLKADCEEITEVTKPSRYDRVELYDGSEGEIIDIMNTKQSPVYRVKLDTPDSKGHETVLVHDCDFSVLRDGYLPMWGTLWAFDNSIDNDWLSGEFDTDGLQLMSDCGFRIYEQEDYGYIFGIDGAGYDFYESHWLPLYRARGMRWDEETRSENAR